MRPFTRMAFLAVVLVVSAGIVQPGPAAAAPIPVLVDMDGQSHDVEAALASGKAVALVFWQTWCRSCEREAPEVVEAARDHEDHILFFGVISGPDRFVDDEEVKRVAHDWGYAFPLVRDRDLGLTREFRVSGTPTIVVLGPGGKSLYRGRRAPEDWSKF